MLLTVNANVKDGSLIPTEESPTLAPHSPPKTVTSAVVFYEKTTHPTQWHNRKVIALQIRLPTNTTSTNYTADVTVLGGECGASVGDSSVGIRLPSVYTAIGVVESCG